MSRTSIEKGLRHAICISLTLVAFGVRGATIVVPAAGKGEQGKEEMRAAAELRHIWFIGTGEEPAVRDEDAPADPHETGPWFFVGETALARARVTVPVGLKSDEFRVLTLPGGRVVLRAATATAIGLAVDWYAQHAMGVRWFMPGPSGEVVTGLKNWSPPALDRVVAPAFVSRWLGGLDPEGEVWARRNGLHEWLHHSHALARYFPSAEFIMHPDWFPLWEGHRYLPAKRGDANWQPNLALPEVAARVAAEVNATFDREQDAAEVSLSINDSIRFDQSEDTIRARGPLRWFRGRPDYSDVVFGFMNRVADEVAPRHPNKWLNAYAYLWCENTPKFPVRPSVVPWLTADRSQWYDPAFAAEDRALIGRWCHSGAKIVGIYDYLYGSPFLVPRVTSRLTAESIRFAHRAGVRAFYAEAFPHWAFDGPKLWVAAQLLWDPSRPVDELLEEYYTQFWKEAASPMRRFYERCEEAWRGQPAPGWWLKYYKDEDQAELYPPALRAELKSYIVEAETRAEDPAVRARVTRVSEGFSVTEAFADFCEARTALSKAMASPKIDRHQRMALIGDHLEKRAELIRVYKRAVAAGALSRVDLEPYIRADPEWEGDGRQGKDAGLKDPGWRTLKSPARLDDGVFTWSVVPWLGRGEPVEGRVIRVSSDAVGRGVVNYIHCKSERLQQWIPASPGKTYEASVFARGRVSPGNETFLIVNWMDSQNRYAGNAVEDRLPDGDWSAGKTLRLAGQAPAAAAIVGIGVFTYNQTGQDFAAFSNLSLKIVREALPPDDPRR